MDFLYFQFVDKSQKAAIILNIDEPKNISVKYSHLFVCRRHEELQTILLPNNR